jgi:electron transport complex protein RnfG
VTELRQAVTRNGLLLAAFALLTALLVAGTYLGTRDTIAAAQRAAEEKALLQIVPRDMHDNSMLDDHVTAQVGDPLLQLPEARPIYRARRDGNVVAVIVPALAPDGYSGASASPSASSAMAASPACACSRTARRRAWETRSTARNRTGSMASSASRSRRRPHDRWRVRRDGGVFDQFTGATITPRAVVAATRTGPGVRRQPPQPCSNSRSHAMQDTRTAPGRWVNE